MKTLKTKKLKQSSQSKSKSENRAAIPPRQGRQKVSASQGKRVGNKITDNASVKKMPPKKKVPQAPSKVVPKKGSASSRSSALKSKKTQPEKQKTSAFIKAKSQEKFILSPESSAPVQETVGKRSPGRPRKTPPVPVSVHPVLAKVQETAMRSTQKPISKSIKKVTMVKESTAITNVKKAIESISMNTSIEKKSPLLNKAALKSYKDLLLKKKEELLAIISLKKMPIEATESSRKGDWIDQSSEDNDIYINMHLRQTDARVLKAIEGALHRIENSTFGICESCDNPISPARLKAVPWAKVCVTCKEKKDQSN